MRQANYILSLVFLVYLASCSRAFDPDVRTGATPQLLEEGHPDVRTSAIGFYDEDGNSVLDVDTDIVYNSLIYSSEEGIFEAGVGVQIQIMGANGDGEGRLIKNHSFSVDVTEGSRRLVESSENLHLHNRLDIEPGQYEIIVAVTDRSSGKTTRSSTNAIIYDPGSERPDLTHVKVMGIDSDSDSVPQSVTTYDIPGRIDSLRFQFYVTKPDEDNEMSVNMRLIEFESDNEPPRDMSGIQPTPGSIQYRGINYNQSEVLEEINRTLIDETGTILIEYTTPRPEKGNFRFQVQASSDNGDLHKARDFSAKSDNYPHIETTREMVKPLAYLMGRRDYERIQEIEDSDSLKSAIDNFWYSELGSPDLARRVIELYYTRVEEANKQFSSFKEGWMTDMGMVYILFGPPYYVERSLDTYTWIYGYDRGDPRRVFRFKRTRMDSDSHPFSHYILQRQRLYHTVEYQQREMWLNGSILNRSM
ncbi:MAG: GWxTD domain-containing protein [Balneolales bacterium]